MLSSTTPILALLISNLFIGMLIMWYYYQSSLREEKEKTQKVRTTLKNKDASLKELTEEVAKQESDIKGLQDAIAKKDRNIQQISAKVKERDDSLSSFNRDLSDLRATRDSLNLQLDKREETIGLLREKIEERDDSIRQLGEELEDLREENREIVQRAEAAEAGMAKLEAELGEMGEEATTQKERIRRMQDDLTVIDGIGPKVSSVLREAGITSFSKLAEREADEIQGILVAENPRLMRLTDPSTWGSQARMAADGDWGGLKALQDSIKEERRAKELPKKEPIEVIQDIPVVVS